MKSLKQQLEEEKVDELILKEYGFSSLSEFWASLFPPNCTSWEEAEKYWREERRKRSYLMNRLIPDLLEEEIPKGVKVRHFIGYTRFENEREREGWEKRMQEAFKSVAGVQKIAYEGLIYDLGSESQKMSMILDWLRNKIYAGVILPTLDILTPEDKKELLKLVKEQGVIVILAFDGLILAKGRLNRYKEILKELE